MGRGVSTHDRYRGETRLYRLSHECQLQQNFHHPLAQPESIEFSYILISHVEILETKNLFETFAFAASENGDVLHWLELPGSQKRSDPSPNFVEVVDEVCRRLVPIFRQSSIWEK